MRLRDNSWGLRVVGDCSKGMEVEVDRRDGSKTKAVIGSVVARMLLGESDAYVCTIASKLEAEKLAARPNSSAGEFTHAEKPIPPDEGTIPFDGPYIMRK